jgi:hypothetical protein
MNGARWQVSAGFDYERGWPCQRLRVGWALVLFFFFEVLLGQKLPLVMPYLMLGIGLALLVSAQLAIRDWQHSVRLALVRDAIERRPRG